MRPFSGELMAALPVHLVMQSPLNTDRGKLRMEKLRQLEREQLQWEQDALVMPEVRPAPLINDLLTRACTVP